MTNRFTGRAFIKDELLPGLLSVGMTGAVALTTLLVLDHTAIAQDSGAGQIEIVQRVAQHDAWYHRCAEFKDQDGELRQDCEIVQTAVLEREDGQAVPVLSMAFVPASDGEWLMTVAGPLNIYLPDGFPIEVDDRLSVVAPYRNCNEAGCWVVSKLNEEQLDHFRAGSVAKSTLRLLSGEQFNIQMSLNGFTSAASALERGEIPPVAN